MTTKKHPKNSIHNLLKKTTAVKNDATLPQILEQLLREGLRKSERAHNRGKREDIFNFGTMTDVERIESLGIITTGEATKYLDGDNEEVGRHINNILRWIRLDYLKAYPAIVGNRIKTVLFIRDLKSAAAARDLYQHLHYTASKRDGEEGGVIKPYSDELKQKLRDIMEEADGCL